VGTKQTPKAQVSHLIVALTTDPSLCGPVSRRVSVVGEDTVDPSSANVGDPGNRLLGAP